MCQQPWLFWQYTLSWAVLSYGIPTHYPANRDRFLLQGSG